MRAGFVFAFDDEIGGGPRCFYIALFYQERFEDVVFAPDYLFAGQGILNAENWREWVDFDLDCSARFFEQVFVGMGQEHYGLLWVIDGLIGQARLILDE